MQEQTEKKLTGYPSIDKPWLKYYSEEAINAPLPECTMYQYIWENNKDHLSDIALRYFGAKITYGKLFENIKKAANAFYAMGIRAGDIVTIMSMHTPETICAIYGLNYIGAVANMVYMTLAEKEILHTLENTESKLFLVLDAALERVNKIKDEISCPIVVLGVADSMPAHMKIGYRLKAKPMQHGFLTWRDFLKQDADEPPVATDHAAPAVIVYTSGTTGESKGVVLSGDNFNSIPAQVGWIPLRQYSRCQTYLHTIPVNVAFGMGMLHLAFCKGQTTTLGIAKNAEEMGALFSKIKPNRFVMGPPVVDSVIKYSKGNLSSCFDITGGGEMLAVEKEAEFNSFLKSHQSSARYLAGYGMSEFASAVTMNMLSVYKPGTVGIPLVHVNTKIVDVDTNKELKYGEIGELCFCSPSTMLGYYKNSAATEKVIEHDDADRRWMHTEDLGYVDEGGFVFIAGRIKRVYLTRSSDGAIVKIYPQRIEDALTIEALIENCGTIVREDEERIHVPIAFVTLKNSESATTEDVVTKLNKIAEAELPEYDRPEEIIVLDTMPMTPSGKIDYQALEKMAGSLC